MSIARIIGVAGCFWLHACALLTIKLVIYKALATEFGRETADKALVLTASVLRRAITDIDLAASGCARLRRAARRPTTPTIATECAQQVIARALQQSSALPPTAILRFNVAVAMLPDKEFNGAGSIKWLRDAVNAMRAEARRQIRPLNF